MRAIGHAVRIRANAFIVRIYLILVMLAIVAVILLAFGNASQGTSLIESSFIVGTLYIGASVFWWMWVATTANKITDQTCFTSLRATLTVAFISGSVIIMSIVIIGVQS